MGTLLAIDAGNTRIKCGLHDGARWSKLWAVPTTRAADLAPDFAALPQLETIVISNVAGAALRAALTAVFPPGPAVRWITSVRAQCGVQNSYSEPGQLGSDRWAALVAARRLCNSPALVVNAGTALTVDALSGAGLFLGGLIIPGPDLMYRALAENTAALAVKPGSFDKFPTSTSDAIASGAINALCGAIERMAGFLGSAGAARPTAIVSGGAASAVASDLNLDVKVVDNLVLDGLLVIARER